MYEDDFQDKKSRLVVIGSGSVSHLNPFREATGYTGELLSEPSRKSFTQLNFHHGIGRLLGMKAAAVTIAAIKSGLRPGSIQGNALQLGGAVAVAPDGSVLYYFRSETAGDHPKMTDILPLL